MTAHPDVCHCSESPDRRRFFGATFAIGAMAMAGTGAFSTTVLADALTQAQRDALTPDDVLALMKKGNRRFSSGEREDHNYLAQQRASAAGQHPFAVLLSCMDSRAPAETIMDLKIGDAFNSRVAGNIANSDIIGGMEYACKVAGSKVILVMGHTRCGAVRGAVDDVKLGDLTGLLDKIKPAIAATSYTGDRTGKNYAFVDAVARKNVELTMANIRKSSPILAAMEASGAIKIAGAMYNVQTGVIDFFG